jgi:hypothetical protein
VALRVVRLVRRHKRYPVTFRIQLAPLGLQREVEEALRQGEQHADQDNEAPPDQDSL